MKENNKDTVIVGVAVAAFIVGVILVFVGLFLPPIGSIDGNVLWACGQFLAVCAAGLGFKEYLDSNFIKKSRPSNPLTDTEE